MKTDVLIFEFLEIFSNNTYIHYILIYIFIFTFIPIIKNILFVKENQTC